MSRFILWLGRFVECRELEKGVIKTWIGRMNGDPGYLWHKKKGEKNG